MLESWSQRGSGQFYKQRMKENVQSSNIVCEVLYKLHNHTHGDKFDNSILKQFFLFALFCNELMLDDADQILPSRFFVLSFFSLSLHCFSAINDIFANIAVFSAIYPYHTRRILTDGQSTNRKNGHNETPIYCNVEKDVYSVMRGKIDLMEKLEGQTERKQQRWK